MVHSAKTHTLEQDWEHTPMKTNSPPKVTHCRTVGKLTTKELQRMWKAVLKAESEVLSQTAACRD